MEQTNEVQTTVEAEQATEQVEATPVDTTLTVTSGTPLEDVPEPTVPDAPVTEGANLPTNVEPLSIKTALVNAHVVLTDVLETFIKNTEVAAVEDVDSLVGHLESAKKWLVDEVTKYDPATGEELAKK